MPLQETHIQGFWPLRLRISTHVCTSAGVAVCRAGHDPGDLLVLEPVPVPHQAAQLGEGRALVVVGHPREGDAARQALTGLQAAIVGSLVDLEEQNEDG